MSLAHLISCAYMSVVCIAKRESVCLESALLQVQFFFIAVFCLFDIDMYLA